MDYFRAIEHLYSNAIYPDDYILRDDGDGPYIAYWNEFKLGPVPSLNDLESVILPVKLLSAKEFSARFTESERSLVNENLPSLALAVLTAPNGVDVTDSLAEQARFALSSLGFTEERLDEIFKIPE